VALAMGAPSESFAMLASTVFTAVDQLSAASLRGYAQEQSESAMVRDRLREELVDLLLSARSDTAMIRAAAARADWPLPREAAVVLVDPRRETACSALARLDPACLRIRNRDLLGAIVPDPSGPRKRARLAHLLRGARAVIGSTVTLDKLPASLYIAEIAVRLRRAGVLDDDPLFVGEHLDAMLVHQDERLLAALRRQCLAPLDGLPAASRERLEATLTSWLRHMGNRQAMAVELHVHPQTVRYRMAQLRELFGPALDDPSTRASLLLALAWGPPADELPPPAPAGPAMPEDAEESTVSEIGLSASVSREGRADPVRGWVRARQ
jgi:sugar diacid utilization regulator